MMRRAQNRFGRIRTLVLALFLTLGLLTGPCRAMAYGEVETDKKAQLTLNYEVPGAEFRLYKVMSIASNGELTVLEPYASQDVVLEGLDEKGWSDAAGTLYAMLPQMGVEADYTGVTDQEGKAVLTDLEVGLYLVAGEEMTVGSTTYLPAPFFTCLPGSEDGDTWIYEVTADVKYVKWDVPPEEREFSVCKKWKNDSASSRPASVDVEIYRDGVLKETVTLNKDNNWRYSWKAENDGAAWTAAEKKVPAGYKVTIAPWNEKDGIVITNTRNTTPPGPGRRVPPGKTRTGDSASILLPLLGLACGGIGLILLGMKLRSSRK